MQATLQPTMRIEMELPGNLGSVKELFRPIW